MSTTVDSRVVEMKFDNKQFESNVQTSMSTLEKLKQSLNLTGAAKGLENINTATKNVNMSGLGEGVKTVQTKFSALGIIGVTALMNITNAAVNAGKRIASALTIEPIKTGFQEYETQINAVQTILANTSSKGTNLAQVNAALDELNHYADMTIYNFTEMTRNIGTFTAAGVDLDKSVSAIKGIANLAAVSGSNSQQASTAMYQLSQALASGTVKLQDWNSVVNAGMGGQVFQDALKETARVHGVAIDQMITDEGSFRETLKDGWLTSDILTETLAKFTGDLNENQLRTMGYTEEQIQSIIKMGQTANDAATKVKTFTQLFDTLKEAAQSGWTQSWEIIVGDFEEAKELLTDLSDTFSGLINSSADARNSMLQGWKDLGGRTSLIQAVRNAFEGVASIITPVKEAFREIFPPMTAQQLYNITKGIENLTAKFKIGEKTSKDLKSTFKGVFAVLDIGAQAFKAVGGGIADLIKYFMPADIGILNLTGSFGEYLVKIDETIKKTDVFRTAIKKVTDFTKTGAKEATEILKSAGEAVKEFGTFAKEKFIFPGFELFHSLLERVQKRMSEVGEAAGEMKSGVGIAFAVMSEAFKKSDFLGGLQALWQGTRKIAGGIGKVLGALAKTLSEKLGSINFNGLLDALNGVSIGAIAIAITKFLKNVGKPLKGLNGMLNGVTDILDSVRGCFEAYQTQLKAGTLLKIASAIAVLVASIVVLSLIDSEKLSSAIGAMMLLFGELIISINKLSGFSGKTTKACATMISMSIAISILAGAMKKVADLDWEQVAKGLVSIAGVSVIIVGSAKIMSSGSGQLVKGASSLVIFALAIKVLAGVCKDLSTLKWDAIGRGLAGVGGLLAEVAIFLRIAKFGGKAISTATGIVILSGAIKILASACKDFGEMNWDVIGRGLGSIAILLAELALFTNLTGNAKHVISTGIALTIIAGAMKIFASAVADFATLNWDQISRGLTAMGGALVSIAIASKLMPRNMVSIGAGLIVVGAALEIMADVLSRMGNFSWEQIGKGLGTMAIALAELAIGMNAMKGSLAGSAAMLVAVAALAALTPVLSILGAMSWTSIAKGLITIAGAFAIIGIAGAVLTPLVPAILGLAGAFAVIGVSVLGIGAGLMLAGAGLSALAVGLTSLAAAGAAGATAIVASLTVIIMGVIGLIPAVITEIGKGIVALCEVIAEGAPAIGEAFKAIVLTIVDVLVECVPAIAEGAFSLISSLLDTLVQYTPQIVDSLLQFTINILESLANKMPELVAAAVNVLASFFAGIVDALNGIDTDSLLKAIVGIGLLSAIMIALSAVASLVPGAMVGVLGMGVVIAELALVLAAIGAFAQIPGLSWLIGEGGKLLANIGTAIGEFVGGIVGGFMGGVSSSFPKIGSDLSAFMQNVTPFIDGASKIDASTMSGVKALAETILILTAADILKGLTTWLTGGSSLVDFGSELAAFGPHFKRYYESIKGIDGSVVASSANAAKALAEFAKEVPNSGGVAGWFAGENSLTTFAEELSTFGPKLKKYADSVQGLDGNVVTNSANAAKALAELARNLPNTGGMVSWFTGDNDMASFGTSLESFGKSFARYSESMKNVDAGIVSTTTNAATSIVALQKSLPKDGGWFSDDMSLSSFGKDMASFGSYFSAYYNNVSGIDAGALSGVITETNRLVSMAKGMSGLDTGGMSNFGSSLTNLGRAGVDGFVKAFTNATSKVQNAATSMISAFINAANTKRSLFTTSFTSLVQAALQAINSKQSAFTVAGTSLMAKFVSGVKSQEATSKSTFTNIANGCLSAIKNKYSEFQNAGQQCMNSLISGIRSKDSSVKQNFTSSLSGAVSGIRAYYGQFYSAGSYLVDGFARGISANTYKASAQSRAMANQAARAAEKALDEHSPSKRFYKIGDYAGLGFVNALSDYESKSGIAGSNMANSAIDGLNVVISKIADFINNDIDAQPTIRPVLDLTNVQKEAGIINGLFGQRSLALANKTDVVSDRASMLDAINDQVQLAVSNLMPKFTGASDVHYTIEVPVNLEGRQIGKISAPFTKAEIEKIDKFNLRRQGVWT